MILIRNIVLYIRVLYFRRLGMDVDKTARLSLSAKLDKTYPSGVHIGAGTFIASGAVVLSHDFTRDMYANTVIGSNCFIGINVIVLPGVTIGDEVVVGAGSVVTKSVPSNSIVVGCPAKVIQSNIRTIKFGQLATDEHK